LSFSDLVNIELFRQLLYLSVLVLIGALILSIRRKASGTRTGYKLLLVLLGIVLAGVASDFNFSTFNSGFIKAVSVFILITLLFELSVRLNHENIIIEYRNVMMMIVILVVNILILGVISAYLLNINPVHGAVFAIILSSIEYFLVHELKNEGDIINPLVIFFAFTIMVFNGLQDRLFENVVYLLKYLFIGLAMGVFSGIITFRIMRYKETSLANELAMIAAAVTMYIITEQLNGSGLFAVMVLGIFFGNSHVRKTSLMHSFSPRIFKTLEMLIYVLIGFVVTINFDSKLLFNTLIIFLVYSILRFIVMHFYYKKYSLQNKLLLTFAPKGMILAVMILVFASFQTFNSLLLNSMVLFLIYGLLCGIVVEYVERERLIKVHKRRYQFIAGRLHRVR
jgi:cell volume regulation protein A